MWCDHLLTSSQKKKKYITHMYHVTVLIYIDSGADGAPNCARMSDSFLQ